VGQIPHLLALTTRTTVVPSDLRECCMCEVAGRARAGTGPGSVGRARVICPVCGHIADRNRGRNRRCG